MFQYLFQYLVEEKPHRWFILVRFVSVFILTIFVLLSFSTDIIDVFYTYFSVKIHPSEAVIWVGLIYFGVSLVVLLNYLWAEFSASSQFMFTLLLLGPLLALAFRAYEVFHPFPNVKYSDGELERSYSLLLLSGYIILGFEGFITAYFDFVRKYGNPNKGESNKLTS